MHKMPRQVFVIGLNLVRNTGRRGWFNLQASTKSGLQGCIPPHLDMAGPSKKVSTMPSLESPTTGLPRLIGQSRIGRRRRSIRSRISAAVLASAMMFAPLSAFAAETPQRLEQWRTQALELVNKDRRKHGLAPLSLGENLNEAAQAHAEDMRDRNYYAHTSPEGDNVQDRFIDSGGSRWELVAENIARCEGCSPPINAQTIERLQTGWMNSPEHRENVLHEGLQSFGYGIVLDAENGLYAVQTFAGAGTPRGVAADEEPTVLASEDIPQRLTALVNRAREREQRAALNHNAGLDQVASALMPAPDSETIDLQNQDNLFAALPADQQTRWSGLSVIAGACGGCGRQATLADLRSFLDQWRDDPQYSQQLLGSTFDALGFALQVNGNGRKVAVLVLATAR